MPIGSDFSVAVNGNIRHVSGTTRYTVLDLHRWLQDLADNASASGDDLVDITSETPSERSTDNIISLKGTYNIDDDAAKYFYDGSVSQSNGNTLYSGLVVVGSVYGTTTLQVVQNNTLYDTAAPFWGTGINTDASNNILTRMLIKTRTGGNDVDGRRIRLYAREWGATYAEFSVTMGLGNSTAAIFTNQDLNNPTDAATVATWATITNTEGHQLINLSNGNGQRSYFSQWNKAAYSINQLYERAKWLSRRGSASTLYGISGELFRGITHEVAYTGEVTGPFQEKETLTWGTGVTAGSGLLLGLKDDGAVGTLWIQLLTGVIPSANLITGFTSGAKCTAGTVTPRTLSSVYLGQSTGSSLIGAYGIGVAPAGLTNADKMFDLSNTQQQPPNIVNFTVFGLVSGSDRVLVTNNSSGIDTIQMVLSTALTTASATSVVVAAASIPSDTPSTGSLRIVLNDGRHRNIPYTAHNGNNTFTIATTDFSGANSAATGKGVYIAYIDKVATSSSESFSVIYNADRTLFVRVRSGGVAPIKTFETIGTLGSAGGSTTAIRTSDA